MGWNTQQIKNAPAVKDGVEQQQLKDAPADKDGNGTAHKVRVQQLTNKGKEMTHKNVKVAGPVALSPRHPVLVLHGLCEVKRATAVVKETLIWSKPSSSQTHHIPHCCSIDQT